MRTLKSQPIESLRKQFQREWLLIAINRFNPRTTSPITGRLLAHSKPRDPLEKRAAQTNEFVYLVFGSDTFPQGHVAAF